MSELNHYEVIIVGAGPAGVAAAMEAQRCGLNNILILEKGASHSSMIRTYYKEGKRVDAQYAGLEAVCHGILCLRDGNRESYLAFMDSVIQNNKIPIRYNAEVWNIDKKNQNFFEVNTNSGVLTSKTVVIAIGKMGKPQQPDYYKEIPLKLKQNDTILFDINKRSLKNENILIVGGGDTAGEYADLLHKDNSVTLSYRRESFSRMNEINHKIINTLTLENKIKVYLNSNILKIEEENEKPRVTFAEAQYGTHTYSAILYALGGVTPVNFLKNSNIAFSEKSEVVVNEYLESSLNGLYVVGDLLGKAKGGGSIISGFNTANRAINNLAFKYFHKENEASIVSLEHLNF